MYLLLKNLQKRWTRIKEITNSLIKLLIRLIHDARAEKKSRKLILEMRKLHSKNDIPISLLETALQNPVEIIKDILFSVVETNTLESIITELKDKKSIYLKSILENT